MTMLTRQELAAHFKVSVRTIERYVVAAGLPAVWIGAAARFDVEAVRASLPTNRPRAKKPVRLTAAPVGALSMVDHLKWKARDWRASSGR